MTNSWKSVRLEDIFVENPKSTVQVGVAKKSRGSKYPFFTSGESVLKYDEYLVDGENIFLNTGGVAGVNFYNGKAHYSTDTWSIKGNELCETRFLYYYLLLNINNINWNYFEGSALKHLQKNSLRSTRLNLPTLEIQHKFVEIVGSLDDKIELNNKMNQTLEQMAMSLYKHYFVDKDSERERESNIR